MQKSKPKDNHEVSADSSTRPRLTPRPQTKGQSPPPCRGPLVEALSPRPRPARPRTGYQFSDSPEAGLGNNLVTSVPTDSLTKRHVQSIRPTTPATSAARWHSTGRMTDGTGDRAQQGLPTTVLIAVPPADTRTALCYLTPAPRTKRRGGSRPGPCSLGISMKCQPLVLRLVRDPLVASDVLFLLCLGRGQARPASSSPPPQPSLWQAVTSV